MEKPGPGHTPAEYPLIIERPDLQSWPQRLLSTTLTSAFWLIWMLLWLPLITFAGWALFGWNFRIEMIQLGGLDGFFRLIKVYALVIAALAASLLIWAKYNHLRFRGVDRRRAFPPVTDAMLADYTMQDVATVREWQSLRGMIVEHDDHGCIQRISPAAWVRTEPGELPCSSRSTPALDSA